MRAGETGLSVDQGWIQRLLRLIGLGRGCRGQMRHLTGYCHVAITSNRGMGVLNGAARQRSGLAVHRSEFRCQR